MKKTRFTITIDREFEPFTIYAFSAFDAIILLKAEMIKQGLTCNITKISYERGNIELSRFKNVSILGERLWKKKYKKVGEQ